MSRREFPAKVKALAFKRANGCCEVGRIAHMPHVGCGAKLFAGNIRYEHINPDGLTGEPTLENCAVLCRACWRIKTDTYDQPEVARAKRRERKHIGIRQPRKITRWRRFNGEPVYANRSRD